MFTVDACKVAHTDAEVRVVWPRNTRTTASTWIAHTRIVFLCAKHSSQLYVGYRCCMFRHIYDLS